MDIEQPTPIATQTSVGLGNVDNTSDANKPVSTATQTALNLKQNLLPYRSYQAILTQTSTGAPSAVSLNNDFSPTTFTWARTSAGLYTVTANSAIFTANKTTVTLSTPLVPLVQYTAVITSTSIITLTTTLGANVATVLTGVATDVLLTNTLIEIRVYN